jgi:hypothetical protein
MNSLLSMKCWIETIILKYDESLLVKSMRIIICLFLLLLFYSNISWSSPWPLNFLAKKTDEQSITGQNASNSSSPIDFSGYWEGVCDGKDAAPVKIQQEKNYILLKYGPMEEKYFFNQLKSATNSNDETRETNISLAIWDASHQSLIFFHSEYYLNQKAKLDVFFSKVILEKNADQLRIKGEYFQGKNENSETQGETLNCFYHSSAN